MQWYLCVGKFAETISGSSLTHRGNIADYTRGWRCGWGVWVLVWAFFRVLDGVCGTANTADDGTTHHHTHEQSSRADRSL